MMTTMKLCSLGYSLFFSFRKLKKREGKLNIFIRKEEKKMSSTKLARAKVDRVTQVKNELAFRKGDLIEILNKNPGTSGT